MRSLNTVAKSVTQRLAEFVAEADLSRVPGEVLQRATHHVLDTVGVGLAAHSDTGVERALAIAACYGTSGARIWGGSRACALPGAVLVNAFLAHVLDYDDWDPSGGHPSCTAASAALSVGEARHATGRAVLEAYLMGVELTGRVMAACPNARARGWHATPLFGAIGAAAASARLLRLNPRQTAIALGLGATLACGLVRQIGTSGKALQVGYCAHNGVHAALLAQAGFDGDVQLFDGRDSFFDVYFGPDSSRPESMLDALGERWFITDPGMGLKPYPCSFPQFWAAYGIQSLMKEHGLAPDQVARVEVRCSPIQFKEHNEPAPQTGLRAKFSLNYVSAASLAFSRLTRDAFTDERVREPRMRKALEKVVLVPDTEISTDWTKIYNVVTLELHGGRRLTKRVDHPLGHPRNPMSGGEVREKFRDNACIVFDEARIDRVLDLGERLATLPDTAEFVSLLSPSA